MGPLGVVVVFLLGVVLGLLAMVAFVVVAFVLPVPNRRKIENGGNENGTNTTSSTNPMSDSASLLPPSMTSSLTSIPVVVGGIISGPGLDPTFPDVRASRHPFPEESLPTETKEKTPSVQLPAMPLNQYVQSIMAAATQRAKLPGLPKRTISSRSLSLRSVTSSSSSVRSSSSLSRPLKTRQSDLHSTDHSSADRTISVKRQVSDFTFDGGFSAITEETVDDYRYALHVKVESAQGLVGSNKNGLSDPFCKVRVGGQRVRTRWVAQSVDPVWNEAFSLNVSDPEEDTLLLEVFDHEKVGNNKPLGSAIISLKCLVRGNAVVQTAKLSGIARRSNMVDVPATGTITVRMLLTDPWVESEASGDASAKKSKLLRKLDRKEEKEKLREEKEKLREEKEQKVREERQRSKTASLGSMPPPNTSTLNGNNIDLSPYLKMNEEPIKEGMLEIKSLGIWHKRWFVLYENGILAYHKPHKKDEPLGDCYGLVVLSKCRTVLSQKNRKHEERIEIEHTEKKPIFSTHSLTGKKLTSALAHHRGKAHDCTLRVTSSEDTQRWVLALRFASKESDADPLEGLGAINEEGTSTAESSDVMTAVACASDDSSNSDDDDNNNNESDDNSSKAKETARHAEHVGDHHSPHKKDEASSSVTTSTTASTTPAPAPTPTSAPAKERVSFAALASAPMPGPARGRGHSGPLLHQRHMSDEQGKAKEAQADVSSAPAKEANAFVASGGRYVEEGTLKIQTKTGWAKYAFRLYTNGHLAYFHPDFEEPLGLIALRNCQLVQTSLAKLRQAIGGGDKSYLEFQIVNPSAEPLFVGAQPALGLPTVRGKAGLSPELAAQAAYEDIPALDRCRLRAKNHRLLTRWTTAIRDEITLQLAREELVGLDAFGGKEEKIDDDFLGYANLMVRRVFEEMRVSVPFKNFVLAKVQRKLAPVALPRFLAPLRMEMNMGGPMPAVGKGARFTHLGHQFLLEMDIDYGGNGMNFTLETAIVTGLTSYAPTIPIRIRVEVLSVQGQLCIYAGEELQTPIFVCFKSRPTIRLDVQVHIGRALRLDWLPHFQQVISAAIEKGIKKKLVYPARMECFIPYPGRKLDVDLVAPPAPQPVIVAPGAGAPAPTKKNKKIWDIYTYLDSKKNQKKIKVVAQFIDEILNKADYSRIKALFSPDCVLSGGAGGGGGKGSFQRGAGHEGVQDLVSLIHKTYPGIAFYIECVLVDEKTVLCQFKARSAANSETVILQGFFISRVEKRRITEQQHYWSLTAIERHHQRTAADHSSSPAKPPPTTSYC